MDVNAVLQGEGQAENMPARDRRQQQKKGGDRILGRVSKNSAATWMEIQGYLDHSLGLDRGEDSRTS